jgi:hypothetical protein
VRFDSTGVFVQAPEGGSEFLYHMNVDGTGRRRVTNEPLLDLWGVSPDGRWVIVRVAVSGGRASRVALMAYPTGGGLPVFICENQCSAGWGANGKFFYFWFQQPDQSWQAALIPLRPGTEMPKLPPSGVKSLADIAAIPGIRLVHGAAPLIDTMAFVPGPDPGTYALLRNATHRNLYRIPVR